MREAVPVHHISVMQMQTIAATQMPRKMHWQHTVIFSHLSLLAFEKTWCVLFQAFK